MVIASETGAEDVAIKGFDDVANYLRCRQIGVTVKVLLPRRKTIAAELIGLAQKERVDLLVAGAYGCTHLGGWSFGGVTRDLLRGPICCLFSH